MHISFFLHYISSIYHSITHNWNLKFAYITLSELGTSRTVPVKGFYGDFFRGESSGMRPSDSTLGFWDHYIYLKGFFLAHNMSIFPKPATITSCFFILLNSLITTPI